MTRLPASRIPHLWTGLDPDFHERVMAEGQTPEGTKVRKDLESRFFYAEGKPFLLGPPVLVEEGLRPEFETFVGAYHRAIEAVVEASVEHEEVARILSLPQELAADLNADTHPDNRRVHIFRLDLLLDDDGGYWVLETNANCPGGFLYSGDINRTWRAFLEEKGVAMPPALQHEESGFMARWFLRLAEAETGTRPECVALIREEGGNRLELGTFAENFQNVGVEAMEIDPRELRRNGSGPPMCGDRPISHAYLKLGMQVFLAMRQEVDAFVNSTRSRDLFIQNGLRGRWVGDSKLCLAVLSDPAFRDLFDPADLEILEGHIPWSRNVKYLSDDELREVRANRAGYVVKRPLDTRGRGVVVGRGVEQEAWDEAVDVARAEAWLIQDFHETARIERDFDKPDLNRHDLCLGVLNGKLTTSFMRSSGELRVNMARSGRMHPVFMA